MDGNQMNERESEAVWLQEVTSRFKYSTWSRKMTKDAYGVVSIYRVPKYLKALNQEAYLPRVVSLGLFHHKPTNPISEMDRRKVDAVLRMRQKLPDHNKIKLADILRDSVPKIRKLYEDEIEADDETVAWTLLLDGCFILEILEVLTAQDEKPEDHDQRHRDHTQPQNIAIEEDNSDPIYNKNRVRSCQFDILGDFFIMENQIPMEVLVKILELQNPQDAKKMLYKMLREVTYIVHPFLAKGTVQQEEGKPQDGNENSELKRHRHMLELFHSFVTETEKPSFEKKRKESAARKDKSNICISLEKLLRKEQPKQEKDVEKQEKTEKEYLNKFIKGSASELYNSGVKFKPYYGNPSKKKLRFESKERTLFLPAVFLTDTSEMILRNLMAMEVCRLEKQKQLSYYVLLMNTLVEGESDVAVLRRAGVIQSSMGTDDEVMNLLNGLCKGLNLQDDGEDPFVEMKLKLNQWYNNRRMVQLTRFLQQHPRLIKYFSLFWAMVLVVAAAMPSFLPLIKQLFNNSS